MTHIKKYTVKKILSDQEMEHYEGHHFDESHYKIIINEDTDVFKEDGSLLLRFRKNVIPIHFYETIADAFRKVSMKKHDNRGASSGLLEWDKMPGYVGEWVESKKFRTHYTQKKSGKLSKHYISNLSPSNIIGYYEKPDRNKKNGPPCRLTSFSEKERDKWESSIDFFEYIDKMFRTYIPDRHQKQLDRAKISNNYRIGDTCFSTVTCNYSWRTACHKDKGDYEEGFGNLIICDDYLNPNKYKGCYLGFPQYGVCVNCQQTDFLGMDVHEWHCNTEFKPLDDFKPFAKFNQTDFKNNWYFSRLAIVCYLRKNMIKCNN